MWRNWNPVHWWWEYKRVQLVWKTVWRFLQKLQMELPYGPAIILPGIYPKELKNGVLDYLHNHGHCSLIYNTQETEVTQVSTVGWMDG